jgi:hypothetical protein
MCQLHKVALGAAIANSVVYFVHCCNFVYGSKLVEDAEMTYEEVFRYRVF